MTRDISRRNFVVGTASLAAIGAVAACGGGEGSSDEPDVEAGTALAELDSIPVGESQPLTTDDGAEMIVTRTSETDVKVFSAICTHKGCTVLADTAPLMCPCHGSTFDPETGANLSGPAPEPLPEISVEIVDGVIQVS